MLNLFVIGIYVMLVVLADFPSAVLFSGLDSFKLLVAQNAPMTISLGLMVKMILVAATGHLSLFAIASIQTRFAVLAQIPSLITFCIIICAQPVVQVFLHVIPAGNWLGFSLGWVHNPAARDPLFWAAAVVMLTGLILTTIVIQKYSV